MTFNGSNAAQYTIQGTSSPVRGAGTLTINNGITANQSVTLTRIKDIALGYSQTWSIASGQTLTLSSTALGISQDALSTLTVAGPGTLDLAIAGKSRGHGYLTNSAIVNNTTIGGGAVLPNDLPLTMAAGTEFNIVPGPGRPG